jgi:cysteinyl-tRNA synthetase
LSDLLRRYLEWKGFAVKQVMNITDVGHMTHDDMADSMGEDKIEKRARQQRKSPAELVSFYKNAFLKDWKTLNMIEPFSRPHATHFIKPMISLINKLVKKGHAYEANGSVYFHVPSFTRYGRLSGNTIKQLKTGAGGRVDINPEKRNQLDFALWVRNPDHLMQWDSPWGRGYPGWHIECSAMNMSLLGETIDIHTGGEDNIFPHHECEIAQSECSSGKKFVKYWMHARHLMIEGKKMSKSLGNFYRLDDLIGKGFSPEGIRYLLISAHYRSGLNMTEKSLKSAEATVKKIKAFVKDMASHSPGKIANNKRVDGYLREARNGFEKALDDDLGIPDALAGVFSLMTRINRDKDAGKLSRNDASKAYGFMIDLDRVLGLGLANLKTRESIPQEIRLLSAQREQFRKQKKFNEADRIRERIAEAGYVLEDTPSGPRIRKAG